MKKEQNFKRQRKKSAITSALLALVLLLTGTFAWVSISQRALSEVDLAGNPGGRIHDELNKEEVINGTDTTANKDVYAENFGENNVLVRIKLSEYLEELETPITGGNRNDKTTWVPYVLGNTEATRDYVNWTMGGSKTFLPTFNVATDPDTEALALASDASGSAIDEITGGQTALGDVNCTPKNGQLK